MDQHQEDYTELLAARVEHGLSTIVVASRPTPLVLPKRIATLHVRCDARPGGAVERNISPLERAAALIDQMFDAIPTTRKEPPIGDVAASPPLSQRLRDSFNRLAHRLPSRVVLILDGIDRADRATHTMLAALLRNTAQPLYLPLVLTIGTEPRGSFIEVADAVEEFNARRTTTEAKVGSESIARASTRPPTTPPSLDAHVKLERARLRWLEVGLDPTFTLPAAFDLAFEAYADLGRLAKPMDHVEAATLIANIAYDLGDGASLERALLAVESTFLALKERGAEDHASLLLNDMASLRLRMGQALPAMDLLDESLARLTEQLGRLPGPAAIRTLTDLAHTRHLLARLPLHPRVPDVLPFGVALTHAQEAAATFAKLGRRHDEARAVETVARLHAKQGNRIAAREVFATALRMADDIGDATTLARITAGFALLLNAEGSPDAALAMLTTSIELNRFKASPVGLAFDEQLLLALEDSAEKDIASTPKLAARLREAREQLRAAILDEEDCASNSSMATTAKENGHHGNYNNGYNARKAPLRRSA